jgi:hypothetical protein
LSLRCNRWIFGGVSLFWFIRIGLRRERVMRAIYAIGAGFLVACAMPATSRADAPGGAALAQSATAACHCPRPHRHVRYHARYHRHRRPVAVAVAPYWGPYNPPIPHPYDSAYDRVMKQYTLSREVGGEYLIEPPYLPTPPIPGLPHFRVAANGAVFEYDIMADAYVPLARSDVPYALPGTAPTP